MPAVTALARRPRGLGAALALAALVAACGGVDAAPRRVLSVATPACPPLGEVVRLFGATMRGGSPYPLGAYFTVEGGATVIGPPAGASEFCAQSLGRALRDACAQAGTSGWCAAGSTLTSCLAAVESLMNDPSYCPLCGDGVCVPNDCPEDCACGDGRCDPTRFESIFSCPADCPPACGDGSCTGAEICGRCEDLPYVLEGCAPCDVDCCQGGTCGDGACVPEIGETPETCEQDCALGTCGDGVCMGGETLAACPRECPGAMGHCLQAKCRADDGYGGCADPREVCGDGVCMGCEMWTCAIDCAAWGHPLCLAQDGSCPAHACGDGLCERTGENAVTCPLDCVFTETIAPCGMDGPCDDRRAFYCPEDCATRGADWCGDGVCQRWEGADACPADCAAAFERCAAEPSCGLNDRRCATLRDPDGAERAAVIGCDGGCAPLEVCADLCVQDAAGARCLDCGWPAGGPAPDGSCARDAVATCTDAAHLSSCLPDATQPDEPACAIRTVTACPAGCAFDRCLPCQGACP